MKRMMHKPMKSYLISLTSLALLATLLLTACSGNDEPVAQGQSVTLTVPIELVVSNPLVPGTRATGDPGLDDELPPPAHLYAFAWVYGANDEYTFYYTHRGGLTSTDWTYTLGTDSEDASARYRLNKKLVIPSVVSVKKSNDGDQVGRIYAIATNKELTAEQLKTIAGSYASVVTATPGTDDISTGSFDSSPEYTLAQATLSLADWTSDELRDLYTTPYADPNKDYQGVGNGYVVYNSSSANKILCGTLRLYHCAAKVDFTWEMDASLRATESVSGITLWELPTSCRLFSPTWNPDEEYTSVSITTDVDTKWIGRQYFYILQPNTGEFTYSVSYSGERATTNSRFSPTTVNRVFTGWYRVVAKIAP